MTWMGRLTGFGALVAAWLITVPSFPTIGVGGAACAQRPSEQDGLGDDSEDWEADGAFENPNLGASRARVGTSRVVPDVVVVRSGDTLWDLTERYYGTPYEWPRVWSYNPEVTNPHWIYPADRLRLVAPGAVASAVPNAVVVRGASQRSPVRSTGSVWLRDQGYLDHEALRQAGRITGAPEDHMLLSVEDKVYLSFPEGETVAPGAELTIFREQRAEEREARGKGRLVRIYGTVRIDNFDRDRSVARATITEALEPIERGFLIANVPRRFDLVDPVPSVRDLPVEVIAALHQREMIGDFQVCFINAGSEQGLVAGNRVFVVRAIDPWRAELPASEAFAGATDPHSERLDAFPDESVAEGMVVNVRATTSAVVILTASEEVRVGDRAALRQGE